MSHTDAVWKGWRDADPEALEPHYSKWVGLLTSEGLHAKADIATVLAMLDAALSTKQDSPVLGNAPNGGCTEKVERYERVEQAVVNLEYGTGAVGEFVSADTARQLMRELAAERRQYAQCSEALNRALSATEASIRADECKRIMEAMDAYPPASDYGPPIKARMAELAAELASRSQSVPPSTRSKT